MTNNKNLVLVLGVSALFGGVLNANAAQQLPPDKAGVNYGHVKDDMPHPLEQRRRALRQQALEQKLSNPAASRSGKSHQVAKGQYVELEREGEESIWTVLGQFGELESPFGILQGGTPGPLHNEIPQPDRAVDNSTIWTADFSREHYLDLLFSEAPGAISMRNFYIELSANRYTVNGDISDWVTVPYRAAHYGRDYCGSIVCQTTWWFVRDATEAWYNQQITDGMSIDDINAYLSQFDVWDRYDYDGDGNFDEPDGYIDHFQAVHAGEGQETGGGAQGSDAIWSHRWYVQLTAIGAGGPTLANGDVVPFGGVRVGNSNYWIGDYTVEPENGAVGVFAHEYAHDLGLPDLYDTSGNTCGSACENSTAFWTLMSSGSYGNDGQAENGIGTKPTHMGAWEKLQLGWLNYELASARQKSEHKLGPATANTKQAQALIVLLPDKQKVTTIGMPYAGDYFWYSGQGNNLNNSMAKTFMLPANASFSAQVNYDIEVDWDYAYLAVSTDGGVNWSMLETDLSSNTDPNGNNLGFGITGSSGGAWVSMNADLSAYTGEVMLALRYITDAAVVNSGFLVDNIAITSLPVEDAEMPEGWDYAGFLATTGTATSSHFNAYIAEFRNYRGFDDSLRTGPYNFGFLDNPVLGNWVEHYAYQDGLLVSYWDSSEADNSTSAHPGSGLILPIDAHPQTMYRADGMPWRSRIQSYDSTFGLSDTDELVLHFLSQPSYHPSQPAASIFDDMNQYWNPETPTSGVMNPHTGTTIRVKSISAQGNFMQVQVAGSK